MATRDGPTVAERSGVAPTINDVAERAGVSKSLVSLVIRGSSHVSETSREAVRKAIIELGYRPNGVARSLVEGRTRTIGVVIADMRNPWYVELVESFQMVMSARGMTVLMGNGRLDSKTDESLIEAFLTMRVDGLFMIGLLPVSGAVLSGARSVPTVVSATGELKLPRVDRVLNDDYLGTKLAVEHLTSLGHRRVAYLGGITGEVGSARFAGYQETMTEQGFGREVLVQTSDFTDRGGHDAAKLLLNRTPRPTAIVGWNDYSAIGALVAADELGLRVPEELSVVGYDNSHVARLARISLTTVDPMNSEVGRVAGDLLWERLQSRRRPAVARLVTPSLVVRASSGRPMLNNPDA